MFIKFQENLDKLDSENAYKPWIYKVARNLCLNKIRDEKLHKEKEEFAWTKSYFAGTTQLFIKDNNQGPATQVEKKEEKKNLFTALENLDEDTRNALLLKYSEQLTRNEIAETMDISLAKVKRLLSVGLSELRKNKKKL